MSENKIQELKAQAWDQLVKIQKANEHIESETQALEEIKAELKKLAG